MPPPPPPAPPPLFKGPASGNQGKANFDPPPDRNALLSQIRKGARLKKAETNDRSSPLIEGSKSTSSSTASKRPTDSKSNGPFPVIPPGGLFAQGIPKLRPTVPRTGTQGDTISRENPSPMVIQSIKSGHSASFLDHHRVGQLSGSRSQPPSPVSKPRMTTGVSSYRTVNSETSETASLPSGNPNFPDDITLKGPAPAPPPASQKPNFKPATTNEPSKPTVRRSASQTSLGQRPRLTRPPPNVKPPPPPKSANGTVAAPPAPPVAPPPPPSKPPNILRRQSFGVGENHVSRFAAANNNKLSLPSNGTPKTPKSVPGPPPPPPRNNSAPHELNQLVGGAGGGSVTSSPSNHWNKMNIAPPPPPNRGPAVGASRGAPIRPPPPRAPAPPPPPPPQHQMNSHQMQAKVALSASMAPPPPARVSSMKQTSDFEERFKFHPAQSLPKPEKFPNTSKTYPSKANHSRQKQSTRRMPPPPPPQGSSSLDAGRGQQPLIHVQLNSGILSSNYAHS